jgi:hypothetical protein
MADLNVQPKRRAAVWPWLLLILVIAAVAYFVLREKNVINNGTMLDSASTQRADTSNQLDTTGQYRTDTIRNDTTRP